MKNPHALLQDEKQIETIESIERVDKDGYLYHMNCTYDYYHLPEPMALMLKAGCSVFITRNREGDVLFCRNYDFSHYLNFVRKNGRTGLNMIVEGNNPAAKYRSLGAGDCFWIDFKNASLGRGMADDGKTDLSAFLLCPYLCMDGVNEKGVAICILSLLVENEWTEIPYESYEEKLNENKFNFFFEKSGEVPSPYILRASIGSLAVNKADKKAWIANQRWIESKIPGKPVILHPVLMRMVLDNCANVDEAIALMRQYNIKGAMPGADYHLMVADSSGKSRLVEWTENEMFVHDIDHATNHWVSKADGFFPEGCDRDAAIVAGMNRFRKGGMSQAQVEALMRLVIQDPDNNNDDGKTQYSCIYNLTKKTLKIFSYGNMDESWEYALNTD